MIAYAICDKTNLNFNDLEASLKKIASKASMIVYRDKENPNYEKNAELFIKAAKNYSFEKILLHSDIDLASKIKADGIHLQSSQIDKIEYAKEKGLFVVISTHTLREAMKAEILGADMITVSPIFHSPNKSEPIGIVKLKEVASKIKIPVIALGGILTYRQIKECKEAGAAGFASIRYFA